MDPLEKASQPLALTVGFITKPDLDQEERDLLTLLGELLRRIGHTIVTIDNPANRLIGSKNVEWVESDIFGHCDTGIAYVGATTEDKIVNAHPELVVTFLRNKNELRSYMDHASTLVMRAGR